MRKNKLLFNKLSIYIYPLYNNSKIKLINATNKEEIIVANTANEIINIPKNILNMKVIRYGLQEEYIVYELVE